MLDSIKHLFEFQVGHIVYLKTDTEQAPRIVTGITLRPQGTIVYGLTHNTAETWHYAIEISSEKDIILCTTN
jgi:hypothetical protein